VATKRELIEAWKSAVTHASASGAAGTLIAIGQAEEDTPQKLVDALFRLEEARWVIFDAMGVSTLDYVEYNMGKEITSDRETVSSD
jgi:hypothetical protein